MIRVLISEDSAVVADHIKGLLESAPGIRVVGMARNGIEAVAMAENLKPDVITMDINMPKMDGVEATKQIMQKCPTRIIIITASADQKESRPAFEALKSGALTVLEKPRGYGHKDYTVIRDNLIKTVEVMSTVKVVTRWRPRTQPVVRAEVPSKKPLIVAIGASTGGPAALSVVLKSLSADLAAPILIVQHMTSGFGTAFAGWLEHESALPVKIAMQGEKVRPGSVYIAQDDLHLGVTASGYISLSESYRVKTYHRPSVNYLFESVAHGYGGHAIGVLLTGMGEDGALGLREIKNAGGSTYCQDESTCVVFGMPKTAIGLGAADHIMPLDKIGPALGLAVGRAEHMRGETINV